MKYTNWTFKKGKIVDEKPFLDVFKPFRDRYIKYLESRIKVEDIKITNL